jgi:hypothetical protein
LKYLNEFIREPYQVYAFLNHLSPEHRSKFFYSSTEEIVPHAIKLNLLADMACFNSRDDSDWLVFIDGDAFPVADVVSFGRKHLQEHPLMAVQRKENFGDIQPHPSFCLTTVGFWKEIHGDWKEGFRWKNSVGISVTDVGGNLLGLLQKQNVHWQPLLRSNRTELHPLYFGIYGDIVYHHGAGFREPYSRLDALSDGKIYDPTVNVLYRRYRSLLYHCRRPKTVKRNARLLRDVFQAIQDDFYFYRKFADI